MARTIKRTRMQQFIWLLEQAQYHHDRAALAERAGKALGDASSAIQEFDAAFEDDHDHRPACPKLGSLAMDMASREGRERKLYEAAEASLKKMGVELDALGRIAK